MPDSSGDATSPLSRTLLVLVVLLLLVGLFVGPGDAEPDGASTAASPAAMIDLRTADDAVRRLAA